MQLLTLGRSKKGKQLSIWNVNSFTVFTSQQIPRLPVTTARHSLNQAYYAYYVKPTALVKNKAHKLQYHKLAFWFQRKQRSTTYQTILSRSPSLKSEGTLAILVKSLSDCQKQSQACQRPRENQPPFKGYRSTSK